MICMYGEFADWYDSMMRSVDYDQWTSYLEEFLREHNCSSVYECACGTGNITMQLAKKGFSLTASDYSEEMLMVARKKMLRAGLRFPLICQDMRDLQIHKPVDAVISVCDGVNYLVDAPEKFFGSAFRALKPGGILLFDISSEYKLRKVLDKTSFSDVSDDWAYICDCDFDEMTSDLKMYLNCFVKDGTHYRRFEEYHVQHAYTIENIKLMLAEAHFEKVNCYDWMKRCSPADDSERIQFCAVKPLYV